MYPPSHVPDDLDIATWLEPRAALALVQKKIPMLDGAIEWIVERLRANRIMALAENANVHGKDYNRVFMRPEYWKHWAYLSSDVMNFWHGGDVSLWSSGGSTLIGRFFGVRFDPLGFGVNPVATSPITATAITRAPSFKAGLGPSETEIVAKADEMRARGMRSRDISKHMRHEAGFENVATRDVRVLVDGRYPRTGRKGLRSK